MSSIRKFVLSILVLSLFRLVASTTVGGGIETRTNVQEWADLAVTVENVHDLLQKGEILAAKLLYSEAPPPERSLRSLSLELKGTKSPNYIFHLQGLVDLDTFHHHDVSHYADSFVQSSMQKSSRTASTAILVLIEWMYATHLLYQGVDKCQKRSVADMPEMIDLRGGGMDEFIALWNGPHQQSQLIHEHTLYSWVQMAGSLFGQLNSAARVNTQLQLLFQEGNEILSTTHSCLHKNRSSVPNLWNVVQRMVTQMTIPLFQMLIHSLIERDVEQTSLYALAVVPQISQCRPSVFARLKDELLQGEINFAKVPDMLKDLRLALDCLGITCHELGDYYATDSMWQCHTDDKNASPYFPLADYTPTTTVKARSRFDLDIYQLGILTSSESYDFGMLLYRFGRNSHTARTHRNEKHVVTSLQGLAVSPVRQQAAPFYSYFTGYHDDPSYADTLVTNTLSGTGKWGNKDEFGSTSRRTEVVVETCAFQIMFLAALAEMEIVVQGCHNGNKNDHLWDVAAAYLIGSLEGPSPDSMDGVLFWNLANKRAFQFGTVDARGYAEVNAELETLLFAGKGELDALDCNNLERTVGKLQHLLLVPLVQSTLRFAATIQDHDGTSAHDGLAGGETFALSVLPIVATFDSNAASRIERNMIVSQNVKPLRDGPQAVADAFNKALADIVDCRELGDLPPYILSCTKEPPDHTWFFVLVSLLSFLSIGSGLSFFAFKLIHDRKMRCDPDSAGSEIVLMFDPKAEIL